MAHSNNGTLTNTQVSRDPELIPGRFVRVTSRMHREVKVASVCRGEPICSVLDRAWRQFKESEGKDLHAPILERTLAAAKASISPKMPKPPKPERRGRRAALTPSVTA